MIKGSGILSTPVSNDRLVEKRENFAKLGKFFPMPQGVDVTFEYLQNVSIERITPSNVEVDGCILYAHGGGFVMGSTKIHRSGISRIAKAAKTEAISIDYSLAPESPFPTQIDEVIAVYTSLLETYTPDQIVFGGDSAGGTIVLGALLKMRDNSMPLPAGAVILSAPIDGTLSGESIESNKDRDILLKRENIDFFIASYLGDDDIQNPYISSYFADFSGMPPLLIQAASEEVFLTDAHRLHQKALDAGVDATLTIGEGMWHAWFLWAHVVPESFQAVQEIATFIRDRIRKNNDIT